MFCRSLIGVLGVVADGIIDDGVFGGSRLLGDTTPAGRKFFVIPN